MIRQGTPPTVTFETSLRAARHHGYEVGELDPPRGYFCVRTKACNDVTGGVYLSPAVRSPISVNRSAFCMQVYSTGAMRIAAQGDCVSEDSLHSYIRDEYTEFVAIIDKELALVARGAAVPR